MASPDLARDQMVALIERMAVPNSTFIVPLMCCEMLGPYGAARSPFFRGLGGDALLHRPGAARQRALERLGGRATIRLTTPLGHGTVNVDGSVLRTAAQ